MRYVIDGNGWWVDRDNRGDTPMFFGPGTMIDDSLPQWAALVGIGPPMDAAPLDYPTYYYMISYGVVGLGYSYTQVSTRFLVGGLFTLDQSRLGGSDVLG